MIRIAAMAQPCYGSTNLGVAGRNAGFGARKCWCAYGRWICFGGYWGAAKGARIVIGVVVSGVVVVNLVGIATSHVLDRLALLFQLAHVCFESGFEFALSAAKLRDGFADRLA